MSNNKKSTSLYEYYKNLFKLSNINYIEIFEKDLLLQKHLLQLGKFYSIKKSNENNKVFDSILFSSSSTNKTYKLDSSSDNYLFKYFIKTHLYLLEYINNIETLSNISISEIEIKDYISNQFFSCLKNYSIDKKENFLLKNKTDYELVSSLCIKERLTFYNYLSQNSNLTGKQIKSFLNKKYMEYILMTQRNPNLSEGSNKIDDFIEVYFKKEGEKRSI
jgi:hypothetical protein